MYGIYACDGVYIHNLFPIVLNNPHIFYIVLDFDKCPAAHLEMQRLFAPASYFDPRSWLTIKISVSCSKTGLLMWLADMWQL